MAPPIVVRPYGTGRLPAGLRTLTNIATLLAAVAGILSLSVASALRDQHRLLDDFTAENRDQLHAAVKTLGARLEGLEQDTRMLTELVERSMSGRELEPSTERRVWSSAFQSLANVVEHYRSIALYRPDGSLDVMGLDPHEDLTTGDALLDWSRQLAPQVTSTRANVLGRPAVRHGQRAFFLYGAPVRRWGSIVVTSDVALLLAPLVPPHPSSSRLYVVDPGGAVWAGCGSEVGCREMAPGSIPAFLREGKAGVTEVYPRAAHGIGLPSAPAVRIIERLERPTGTWVVTWLASSQAIVNREQSLLLRLVATVVAAAVAVAGVGLVILRQQRKAFVLEGRLQYAQALASARETSEAIVENAPLGVLGIAQDGRVALANRFLTDRLGPIRVGVPLAQAFSAEGAAWLRELEPLLLGKVPAGDEGAAFRDLRPTSTSPAFDVRIAPVRNPALGVQTFALFEDRSKIHELENQLVRAEKLITVGVLSAGIAHEIGSPLAVIRGRAEQVLRDVGSGPRAEDLRIIIKHIDHITTTIRQLLDFSRRQPIERRAVALESIVRRARELLQWKLEANKLQLETEIEAALPMLAADPDQLQQVLVNLVLNACDASARGGVIRLVARLARASGVTGERLVALEVIDHGCGIAAEHLHAVFDPFFTTKKRGEGTGLGLSIALSIVRNHGGKLDLASAYGKGTTVAVLWPAVPERQEPRA
jgi:two-component system sensor histidine kinase HydH